MRKSIWLDPVMGEDLLSALPEALRFLRCRAGMDSLRAAARAIQLTTGTVLGPSTLSEWERGIARPSLESLVSFLLGLGYDFVDFQAALEEAVAAQASSDREEEAFSEELAQALTTQLRSDGKLRQRLREILSETSTDPDQPIGSVQELMDYLGELDRKVDD